MFVVPSPASAQYYCYPSHVYCAPAYVCPPVYCSPVYAYPSVCLNHVYAYPQVVEVVAPPEPVVERVWHPGFWERVQVKCWVKQWHQAEWVDAPAGPDGQRRQILKEGYYEQVETLCWQNKWHDGYYTHVYPPAR